MCMSETYETSDLYEAARLRLELPDLYIGAGQNPLQGRVGLFQFYNPERIIEQKNLWRNNDSLARYKDTIYDCKRDLRRVTE